MNDTTATDETVTVLYCGGHYCIHATGCADIKRAIADGFTARPPTAGSLFDIAKDEYADFIAEDPDYWTDDMVLSTFGVEAKILPCVKGRLRTT